MSLCLHPESLVQSLRAARWAGRVRLFDLTGSGTRDLEFESAPHVSLPRHLSRQAGMVRPGLWARD